jgi:16S rRNA (cytidine1402-2'-O)-methyltransferase
VTGDRSAATGRIVLVATPIGNLGDISKRAVEVLAEADLICCEDTRRTRALLSALGVSANPRRLVSFHEHNEAARIDQVVEWVAAGRTIAVVSDAGMPAISDPGARLVAAAASAGLTVTVAPGASAILAALAVSGLPTERFCVEGFLPRKGAERARRIAALSAEERTTVVLEAPGRVAGTLAELAELFGERPVAVVRELTKVHEEVWRGTLGASAAAFAERPARGEVVLVVGGAARAPGPSDAEVHDAVATHLAHGDGPRRTADAVAAGLGVPRRRVYELAIALQKGREHGNGPPGL